MLNSKVSAKLHYEETTQNSHVKKRFFGRFQPD